MRHYIANTTFVISEQSNISSRINCARIQEEGSATPYTLFLAHDHGAVFCIGISSFSSGL